MSGHVPSAVPGFVSRTLSRRHCPFSRTVTSTVRISRTSINRPSGRTVLRRLAPASSAAANTQPLLPTCRKKTSSAARASRKRSTAPYRDQIGIGSPGQGAYAVFVLGVPTAAGYAEGYTWYRSVDSDGKGVPRYFSHLDWDGDGDGEILLDVFGASRRWFAGLSRRQGEWVRTFQDACGSGSSSGR